MSIRFYLNIKWMRKILNFSILLHLLLLNEVNRNYNRNSYHRWQKHSKGQLYIPWKTKTGKLYSLSMNNSIAILEAKDNTHSISHGLQSIMNYAKTLEAPFAYSSNRDDFAEHDFLTQTKGKFGLSFPQIRNRLLGISRNPV